jgi:hypothetical protein
MFVPEEVALTLARKAGAKTFGRSWKGEDLVPAAIAERTLQARRAEVEAADRRRLEYDSERRAWEAAYVAERRRVIREEVAKFSAAEMAGEEMKFLHYAWSSIGPSSPTSSRAAQTAQARADQHMLGWVKRHPEPQP